EDEFEHEKISEEGDEMDDREELLAVTVVEPPVVNSEWDDGIDISFHQEFATREEVRDLVDKGRLQVTRFPSAGEYRSKRKKKFPPLIGENEESGSDSNSGGSNSSDSSGIKGNGDEGGDNEGNDE
ncbi:hypothetical protein HID58_034280, partial [Brassica napus]